MYRLAISVAVLSGLISALGAHKASAQLGLDSIVRQLGERAVEELVRPDPPQTTAPRTTAPTPQRHTAPSGPTQSEVLEVQQGLARLGYNPGTPDGLKGPNTASAIAAFQRDRGLRQTGAVSDALLTRLRTAVAGSGGSGGGAAPQDVARPSFDCERAGTPTEYAICGNPELAQLDRQMADAYAAARAQAANPSVIANAQRSWMSRRNACRSDVDCLRASMQHRLADLAGPPFSAGASSPQSAEPAPSSAPSDAQVADQTEVPTTGSDASRPGQESEQPSTISIREDGIRIHPGGRLIVPHPVFQPGSPDYWQHLALARHLEHAAIGEFPETLVLSGNPALMADAAREYLALADVRPYFCTKEEMTSRQPDCMTFSDASYAFAIGGGTFGNGAVEARKPNPFLWWRGANEFDRRRSIAGFLDSGLREQIAATAPDTPIRLLFTLDALLGDYDFNSRHFPVQASVTQVNVPGSNSIAFKTADVVQSIAAPPGKAEALLQMLKSRRGGRAEIVIGVAVDLTLNQLHGGQPRWQSEVVSTDYYLDADATVSLAGVTGDGQQTGASASAGTATATPDQAAAGTSGPVLRQFDLLREDGRIVIDFEGYGELTPHGREAIFYLFASAARDFVDGATDAPEKYRYKFPFFFSMLNDDVSGKYFDCTVAKKCFNHETGSYFAGENEFQVRQAQVAFEQDVAPKLVVEAPSPPFPMRIYLDARLSDYDFDQEAFGVSIFQEARPDLGPISRMFDFQSIFVLVPGRISMAPDSAEQLVASADGDPVLRIDFDVLNFGRLSDLETVMTLRPVAIALVTGSTRETIHYEQTYDTSDDVTERNEAALAFLGSETAENAAPKELTAYSILGVAPGMHVEAAREALSRSFDDVEIDIDDGIVRAERGYCSYRGAIGDVTDDEVGSICFMARLKDQRVSRVSLQQIVHPGESQALIDEARSRFGVPESHGDGDVPDRAMMREYFGWGAKLGSSRAVLGRPEITLPAHEAEVDHVVVNPRIAVVTLRADAPPAPVAPSAMEGGAAASAAQTTEPSSPDMEAGDERMSDADHAASETASGDAAGAEIALLGIAPGMARAEARVLLEGRFDGTAIARADDGTLIVEKGMCRYAAAADPAIETEVGSNCVMVVFGPDDAVSNIVVRYVVAGSHVDAYAAQLEGSFGVPASRVLTEQAQETLILGWGPELEATADELERNASAGQTLHALEARLTQANGVTLATARLDSEPVLSASTDEGDTGSTPPPIDF